MKENEAILLEDGHELKYDGYDPKDPESMIALSLRQNAPPGPQPVAQLT
jgi:N-acetylmuramoyl-L-alanine amidase